MILVTHHKEQIVSCLDIQSDSLITSVSSLVVTAIVEIAQRFPDRWIVWCQEDHEKSLDLDLLSKSCTHHRVMLSHNTGRNQYFGSSIGYIEETPFINVRNSVPYPTWQMNGIAGAIHSDTLATLCSPLKGNSTLAYFLSSMAKRGQSLGLLAYQLPLLTGDIHLEKASSSEVYRFVSEHYKKRWLPFLLFCQVRYERKFPLFSFLKVLFTKPLIVKGNLSEITSQKSASQIVDVLIPTIGRKSYLRDVLKDLSAQTLLPERVIIIEQNPDVNSVSELDYIHTEDWPFTIIHRFIHQIGACNARNIGLSLVEGDWLFMADDDIRFDTDIIESALDFTATYSCNACTVSCLLEGQKEVIETPIQWVGFGSGCSFIKVSAIGDLRFDMALEHGFGEDADFGNQLRKKGVDILYAPHIQIKHLKAPVGGFRAPLVHPWESDAPKPAPTVMVSILKHWSLSQRLGYKLKLWSKFYNRQSIKNPLRYLREMRIRWDKSIYWAHKLIEEHREN